MDMTSCYNEIVYMIDKEPFLPIGVICEDEITGEEKFVADSLQIPILYRKKKEIEKDYGKQQELDKYYTYTVRKRLFK